MTLEHLIRLSENFSDEIPGKVLHGKGDFKVRRNWWQGVVGGLDCLISQGQIPSALEGEVEDFLTHYTSEDFHRQPLTTEKDITRANNLIDKILGKNKP